MSVRVLSRWQGPALALDDWFEEWKNELATCYSAEEKALKVDEASSHDELGLERQLRDINLLDITARPYSPSPRVIRYLWNARSEYDALVDALLASLGTRNSDDGSKERPEDAANSKGHSEGGDDSVGKAAGPSRTPQDESDQRDGFDGRPGSRRLLERLWKLQRSARTRVDGVKQSYKTWRRWSTAAASGGMLAVAGGQAAWLRGFEAGKPIVAWGLLGLTLVGLSLAAATVFTWIAAGDLRGRWRLALTGLPVVLVIVLSGIGLLRAEPARLAYVGPFIVGVLIAIGMIAAVALSSAPDRVLDNAERAFSIVPTAGIVFPKRGSVEAELGNVEVLAEDTSRRERRSAHRWLTAHIIIGGLAALASGAAAVVNVQQGGFPPGNTFEVLVTVLALVGAALTALSTALNPGKRWESSAATAGSCESLAREIGVMTRVDFDTLAEAKRHRDALEDVLNRYDAITGTGERQSFWSRHFGNQSEQGSAADNAKRSETPSNGPSSQQGQETKTKQ